MRYVYIAFLILLSFGIVIGFGCWRFHEDVKDMKEIGNQLSIQRKWEIDIEKKCPNVVDGMELSNALEEIDYCIEEYKNG